MMLERSKTKITVIVILLLLFLSLFIWHGSLSPAPEKGRYPGNDELVENYDKHIGKKVEIGGEIIETDPVKIEIESGDKTLDLKVTGLQEKPEKGDRLTVFGTAEKNRTISSENELIRPFWRYLYMYGVSLIGAVWIGLRLIGQWRFDKKTLSFESRDEPMTASETLSRFRGGDQDS